MPGHLAGSTSQRQTPWPFSKTKMCKFNLLGQCARGAQCVFAHSPEELSALPNLSKTKMCRTLMNNGFCQDPTCTYAHSKDELRSESAVDRTPARSLHRKGGVPQEQWPQQIGGTQLSSAAPSFVPQEFDHNGLFQSYMNAALLAEPFADACNSTATHTSPLGVGMWSSAADSTLMSWPVATSESTLFGDDILKPPSDDLEHLETCSGSGGASVFSHDGSITVDQDDGFRMMRTAGLTSKLPGPLKLVRSAEGNLCALGEEKVTMKSAMKLVRSADGQLCAMDEEEW